MRTRAIVRSTIDATDALFPLSRLIGIIRGSAIAHVPAKLSKHAIARLPALRAIPLPRLCTRASINDVKEATFLFFFIPFFLPIAKRPIIRETRLVFTERRLHFPS